MREAASQRDACYWSTLSPDSLARWLAFGPLNEKSSHILAPRMRKTVLWSCALLLSAHRLAAQALPPDSLFDRLVGRWVLHGTIARQQTTHDVTFAWMLGREYVRMHEVSRERAANGSPAYEAIV